MLFSAKTGIHPFTIVCEDGSINTQEKNREERFNAVAQAPKQTEDEGSNPSSATYENC